MRASVLHIQSQGRMTLSVFKHASLVITEVSKVLDEKSTGVDISCNCSQIQFLLKPQDKNVKMFCLRVCNNRSVTFKL